jgi:hypothetical protein
MAGLLMFEFSVCCRKPCSVEHCQDWDRRASIAIDERQTKHGSSRGVAKIGAVLSMAAIQLAGACRACSPSSNMWERGQITRRQQRRLFLSVFVTTHDTELRIFTLAHY